METGLDLLKKNINTLFFVDDTIPCQEKSDAFRVSGVYEDRIAFAASDPQTDERSLSFAELDQALKDVDTADLQAHSLLSCFVAEYLERVEQARRDAEVDDMWRSAIVCQIQ